jgi:hypothetical protein
MLLLIEPRHAFGPGLCGSATAYDPEQHDGNGDYQEYMDKAPHGEGTDEAKQPQQNQDNGNCE